VPVSNSQRAGSGTPTTVW